MLIALDYDNTYNQDPTAWGRVADLLHYFGHKIITVTLRSKELDGMEDLPWPVYFTNGKPKRQFMEDHDINVDVWIDDIPESIAEGSYFTPEELEQWRARGRTKKVLK